jgi:hypothetical protein
VKRSIVVAAQVRRYHPKWWVRAFALFFLLFSLAGLVHFWSEMLAGERPPNTTEFVVPALMVLAGVILVVHFFTTFVTLFPDAIEVRTLLSARRVDFNKIRGRREYETTDADGIKTRYIKLELLDYQQPALEFQAFYDFDNEFYEWLRSLPNLER